MVDLPDPAAPSMMVTGAGAGGGAQCVGLLEAEWLSLVCSSSERQCLDPLLGDGGTVLQGQGGREILDFELRLQGRSGRVELGVGESGRGRRARTRACLPR